MQDCLSGEDADSLAALSLLSVCSLVVSSTHHHWPWDHMPKGIPDALMKRNWPNLQTLMIEFARFKGCDGHFLRQLDWPSSFPNLRKFCFNGGSLHDDAYDAIFQGLTKIKVEELIMRHGSIHALRSLENIVMPELQTLEFIHINGPPESTDTAMTALLNADLPRLTDLSISLMPISDNLVWYPWRKILDPASLLSTPMPALQSLVLAGLSINRKCLEVLGAKLLYHLSTLTISQCGVQSKDVWRAIQLMPPGSNPEWIKQIITYYADTE